MEIPDIHINRTLRTIVSALVVLTVMAVWVWKTYLGQRPDSLVLFLVLAFGIAAGYGIWGRVFKEAVETAEEQTDTTND